MSETTNFNLSKPARGALDWDTDLNGNFDIIDSEIKKAQTLTSTKITTALEFTPQNVNEKGVADGYASLNATGKVPLTQIALNSSAITTALGFTPQNPSGKNAANGYVGLDGNGKILSSKISLTSGSITTALNFTPESVSNKGFANGYASLDSTGKVPANQIALTQQQVTTAIGYTPENSSNKSQASGYASLNSSGKVPTSQISLTSSKITTGLGFTPENSSNKNANSGYASLDGSSKIPLSQHPSLSLSSLSGISLSSPTSNQVLQYNGTNWVNASVINGITSLSSMGDVQLTSPANNKVLQYNGTKWADATLSERCTVPVRQTVLTGSVNAATGTANFLSAGNKTPTQFVVEVYNNLAGDSATITELRAYDQDGVEINYTTTSTDAYDSRTSSVPAYWNDTTYWFKSNLNDNDMSYTDNSTGRNSSTGFLWNGSTTANSKGWARFLVTLSSSNYQSLTFKLWAGSPENRIPEKVTFYAVNDTYSLANHVQSRTNSGLTEIGSRTFTLSNTTVTQTSHSYTPNPSVNLSATTTNVSVAFSSGFDAYGAVDYVSKISSDVSNFVSGLRAGVTNYIYVDRDSSSGALTYGSTIVKPLYQQIDPVAGIPDVARYMLLSNMSSNTVPSPYVASSSSVYSSSYDAYRAFDGSANTNFVFASGQTTGWLKLDLGSGNQFVAKAYAYTGHINTPTFNGKNWTFEGSNDNTNWTVIDTKTNQSWSNGERKYFTVTSNTTAYRYYRLNISANNGGVECQVNELQIYGIANDQHWFDLNSMTMKVWNGTSWQTKQRVFLGEADTIGNVITYALQGKYESDVISLSVNSSYSRSHNIGSELVTSQILIRYNSSYKWTDANYIYTGNVYGARVYLTDRNKVRIGTGLNYIGYGGATVSATEWGPWITDSFPSGTQTTGQAKVLVKRNW